MWTMQGDIGWRGWNGRMYPGSKRDKKRFAYKKGLPEQGFDSMILYEQKK